MFRLRLGCPQGSQTNSAPARGLVDAVSGFRGLPTSFVRREVTHCVPSLEQRSHADAAVLLGEMHFSFKA